MKINISAAYIWKNINFFRIILILVSEFDLMLEDLNRKSDYNRKLHNEQYDFFRIFPKLCKQMIIFE